MASDARAASNPPNELVRFRGRTPAPLLFGTSGLRGLVTDITDLEVLITTRGFIAYLRDQDDPALGRPVCVAADLRPSSESPDRSIVRAVVRALRDEGLAAEYLGRLPTPALAFHALERGQISVMVTGSHIPFDRNGIKFNKATGEVAKSDEAGILAAVSRVRSQLYQEPAETSPFNDDGWFRRAEPVPTAAGDAAADGYLRRYVEFFGAGALTGMRVAFYQHSAVGRDLLVELLRRLGADVIPVGRSETFVPIDTEAISAEALAGLQQMADEARAKHGDLDAIVSTDGDSDRPLLAGVHADGRVQFLPGDLLGALVADCLGADAVAIPISANDAVDRWAAAAGVTVHKTRIGSPRVIDGMERAMAGGFRRVVGWEPNGGFLVASPLERNGRMLAPLPTRDAALPLVALLDAAHRKGVPVTTLFERLPARHGCSGLIDAFPPETGRRLMARFMPTVAGFEEVAFEDDAVRVGETGRAQAAPAPEVATSLLALRKDLQQFLLAGHGFGRIVRLNYLDGVRITFEDGAILHFRPSGNAPQMRCYTVADDADRAGALLAAGLREPDGVLRRMEAALQDADRRR